MSAIYVPIYTSWMVNFVVTMHGGIVTTWLGHLSPPIFTNPITDGTPAGAEQVRTMA